MTNDSFFNDATVATLLNLVATVPSGKVNGAATAFLNSLVMSLVEENARKGSEIVELLSLNAIYREALERISQRGMIARIDIARDALAAGRKEEK